MESYGNVFDEEWVNLSSMFSCDQDSNHFTGHGLFSGELDNDLNLETQILWPNANESNSSDSSVIDDHILSYTSDHDLKFNFYNYFSQESGNTIDSSPYPRQNMSQFCPSNAPTENVSDQSEDLRMMEGDSSNFLLLTQVFSDETMEEILCLKQDEASEKGMMGNSVRHPVPIADMGNTTLLKRKYEMTELPKLMEEVNTVKIDKNLKKKARISTDNKNKKNYTPKKNQKMMADINDDEGGEIHQNNEKYTNNSNVQSSTSCTSEEDSNASQDLSNLTAKTRAGRGAATDPQSIYARKRRERINERLRILQTIVPNGTKVDISTMLEEAVHYVKFLQLQINLLSSDDKWMYAPIAYNGMDMGLYQNI